VQLVRTPLAGVPKAGVTKVGLVLNTLFPLPVEAVTPVPPLATARVPARVTTPVVAVLGVNPVVPAEKELTIAAGAVLAQVVPLDVNKFPEVLGATNVGAEAPLPKITLFAVSVESPVPPSATARSVMPVIVPPLIVAVVIVAVENIAVPAAIVAVSILRAGT
jgi:hypothetical protein